MNVAGNVSFEPGSRYAVEVGPNGPERSDPEQRIGDDRRRRGGGDAERPQPAGAKRGAQPAGPAVHHPERAAGVSGQFDAVAPGLTCSSSPG
ncbi:hypothetical protein M8494_31305 [Serratia ureilytica]